MFFGPGQEQIVSCLLTSHWPEFGHKAVAICTEGWEMELSYVPKRKSKGLFFILASDCLGSGRVLR